MKNSSIFLSISGRQFLISGDLISEIISEKLLFRNALCWFLPRVCFRCIACSLVLWHLSASHSLALVRLFLPSSLASQSWRFRWNFFRSEPSRVTIFLGLPSLLLLVAEAEKQTGHYQVEERRGHPWEGKCRCVPPVSSCASSYCRHVVTEQAARNGRHEVVRFSSRLPSSLCSWGDTSLHSADVVKPEVLGLM